MIENKQDLIKYLKQDAKAKKRTGIKPHVVGDYVWKYQYYLRKREYEINCIHGWRKKVFAPILHFHEYRFKRLGLLCGFSIPPNVFGPGLSIAHYGTIIVNSLSKVGENCRIQTGVTIGATNGISDSPQLGSNIFLGEGCKLLGGIRIADNVAIGANSVIVKDILEPGTTWGGIPARKISAHDSRNYLSSMLFEQAKTIPQTEREMDALFVT